MIRYHPKYNPSEKVIFGLKHALDLALFRHFLILSIRLANQQNKIPTTLHFSFYAIQISPGILYTSKQERVRILHFMSNDANTPMIRKTMMGEMLNVDWLMQVGDDSKYNVEK